MKCPVCHEGKLTLIAGYDLTLLLICERKLKRGTDIGKKNCSYAVGSWEIPNFDKALDEFIEQFEVAKER